MIADPLEMGLHIFCKGGPHANKTWRFWDDHNRQHRIHV